MLSLNFNGMRAQSDILLPAIEKEVERNKTNLSIGNLQRPFFISYVTQPNK